MEVLSGPVCVEVLSGSVCVCGGIDLLAHCTVVVNSTDKTNTELLTKAP